MSGKRFIGELSMQWSARQQFETKSVWHARPLIVSLPRNLCLRIDMTKLSIAVALLLIAGTSVVLGQSSQDESIAESHIRANVPDERDFEKLIKRDLEQYFKDAKQRTVNVEYELLRSGPTQTGIAYPKFYAWVTIRVGAVIVDQGAVRVPAIEKKRFDVTDFVSQSDIEQSPMALGRIFPKAVADRIRERLSK